MKSSTKFWFWAASCVASLVFGDHLGVFSYNNQVRTRSKMESAQMSDGKKAILLKIEHPWDRRYHQDLTYTFIESGDGTYLPIAGIMAKNVNDAKARRKDDLTRVVEEIIDSNQNGSYDLQRVFYENGIQKILVSECAIGEIDKGELPFSTYQADERRLK
jgi:hypothetical protein